ncbi:hypothetical protein D3C84_1140920 [compost metagenome]
MFPNDNNGSKLVWITDFLPEQLTNVIQAHIDCGAEVMKETIEADVQRSDSNTHR